MTDQFHPDSLDDWSSWLKEHAETSKGVWFVWWKTHTGRPRVSYDDAVSEGLAFGWIDSKSKTLDADRTMMWFSPRRPASGWSGPNKQRVARLEAEGRMRPEGARMVDLAKQTGTWSMLDDVENLVVPDDLVAAFTSHDGAREHWDAFPPSARKAMLGWIVTAKRPDTRARRIAEIAEKAARGERAAGG